MLWVEALTSFQGTILALCPIMCTAVCVHCLLHMDFEVLLFSLSPLSLYISLPFSLLSPSFLSALGCFWCICVLWMVFFNACFPMPLFSLFSTEPFSFQTMSINYNLSSVISLVYCHFGHLFPPVPPSVSHLIASVILTEFTSVARSAVMAGGAETIKIFSRLQEFYVCNLCVHTPLCYHQLQEI